MSTRSEAILCREPDSIQAFRALAVASALDLYADTGIKANTAYTPQNMLRVAEQITKQKFPARGYRQAAAALRRHVGVTP